MTEEANKLVGEWTGVSEGEEGSFIFREDGTANLIIKGKSLVDEEVMEKGTLLYSFDPSKIPSELDLIGIDNSGNELGRMKMILQFLTDDKIKIRTFFNDRKPKKFLAEDDEDTFILSRNK